MIKETLLSLLSQQPAHGYELKLHLDSLLGQVSPMNVGQIYTALNRLEATGLIRAEFVPREERGETKVFSITAAGREELQRWFASPVEKVEIRNELFMKLILARRTGLADLDTLIRTQRAAYLQLIQELTHLATQYAAADDEVALLIDGAILRLEAELHWLERFKRKLT